MKIIFVVRSLNPGGAERQLIELATGLHQRGHHVLVVTFYSGGEFESDLIGTNVQILSLHKRSRWDIVAFFWRFLRLIRQQKPDVIHSYLAVPNMAAVLANLIAGNARIVWGIRASNMDLSRYDWLATVTYGMERRLAGSADFIICNSHAGFRYASQKGFPAARMTVIPNGIDTNRFRPSEDKRRQIRHEWGISNDQILIGIVARLDPMKGHADFLRAAALLSRDRDDVRFVCVGDGPPKYREMLYRMGRELNLEGRILWAGMRTDIASVYNALDILTSSSIFGEGFSNTVGEAMACGKPCVVTDVGDAALIVADSGAVVPPGNPELLAHAWRDLLDRQYRFSSTSIRARIVDEFSVAKLVEQTERALKRLVQ